MPDTPHQPDGEPAFPGCVRNSAKKLTRHPGMTLRDYFAAKAPVTFDVVTLAYGGEPSITQDVDRAAFFAVWAMLQYEYADAMIAAGKGGAA